MKAMEPLIAVTLEADSNGVRDEQSLETDAVRRAFAALHGAVMSLPGFDASTTEAIRLRNAFHQGCHV